MYVIRIHHTVAVVCNYFFAEGKCFGTLQFQFNFSFVICPVELSPQLHIKPAGFCVTHTNRIMQPASALSGFIYKSRTNFQRAQKAQTDSHAIFCREITDLFDLTDIFVHIGSQFAEGSRLLPVLPEEFIKGDAKCFVAVFFSLLRKFPSD